MTRHVKTGYGSLVSVIVGGGVLLAALAVSATDYVWTGNAGGGSNWYDTNNWVGGSVPTDGTLLLTASSADTVTFDSAVASSMPSSVTLYNSWTAPRKMPQVLVLNGSVTFTGSSLNWGYSGINTFTVGDGSTETAAVINVTFSNLNRDPNGTKTYVVKTGGVLNINATVSRWSDGASKESVIRLKGGEVVINGSILESYLTTDADDYVLFEEPGTALTAQFGPAGSFANLPAVLAEIGPGLSFRISGVGLDDDVYIEAVDNGSTFTLTLIDPPPQGTILVIR